MLRDYLVDRYSFDPKFRMGLEWGRRQLGIMPRMLLGFLLALFAAAQAETFARLASFLLALPFLVWAARLPLELLRWAVILLCVPYMEWKRRKVPRHRLKPVPGRLPLS